MNISKGDSDNLLSVILFFAFVGTLVDYCFFNESRSLFELLLLALFLVGFLKTVAGKRYDQFTQIISSRTLLKLSFVPPVSSVPILLSVLLNPLCAYDLADSAMCVFTSSMSMLTFAATPAIVVLVILAMVYAKNFTANEEPMRRTALVSLVLNYLFLAAIGLFTASAMLIWISPIVALIPVVLLIVIGWYIFRDVIKPKDKVDLTLR